MKKEWKPLTDEEREVIQRYEQWQALSPEERKRRLQESKQTERGRANES